MIDSPASQDSASQAVQQFVLVTGAPIPPGEEIEMEVEAVPCPVGAVEVAVLLTEGVSRGDELVCTSMTAQVTRAAITRLHNAMKQSL
jgi:hypothetical protein